MGPAMRVLIINLSVATTRMKFQEMQMAALGLEWERIDAVTPETLPLPADDLQWQRWERPMKAVEIAVFASHCMAWRQVKTAEGPHLIIEDDALLAAETPVFLQKLNREAGIDHVTLEIRSRKKLVGRQHRNLPMRRLYQDRTGAAAYVLWPSGAGKLLSRATIRPGLADAVICAAYELNSWQADPGLAIQLDQCAAYGVAQPIKTESSTSKDAPQRASGLYRARRIASQLRMGLRHLSRLFVAERHLIALSSNWPDFRP